MDLGFGGILEKFEEHWGKIATRALTFLIGLAVAAACMAIIWEWLVAPLLIFFQTPLWGEQLGMLVWLALTIIGGWSSGLILLEVRKRRRHNAAARKAFADARLEIDAMFEEARQMVAEARETKARADESDAQVQNMIVEAGDLLHEVVKSHPGFTEQDRAKWLSRLEDIGKGKGDETADQ